MRTAVGPLETDGNGDSDVPAQTAAVQVRHTAGLSVAPNTKRACSTRNTYIHIASHIESKDDWTFGCNDVTPSSPRHSRGLFGRLAMTVEVVSLVTKHERRRTDC